MSRNKTADSPGRHQPPVTAAEGLGGVQRIRYGRGCARVLTEKEAAATPGALRVFERVAAAEQDADTVWLTLLPGFPDGSYGWAQVDRMLGDDLGPRLYVEPVGQGDSDKPRDYPYSTVERADLVEALWRHHGVRATVVVTFDYTSLVLLELLRRQLERTISGDTAGPPIAAALMINGGLFSDAHTHPWQGTPLLRTPLGALGMWRAPDPPPRVAAPARRPPSPPARARAPPLPPRPLPPARAPTPPRRPPPPPPPPTPLPPPDHPHPGPSPHRPHAPNPPMTRPH